jgi:hypothetical protein
MVDNYPYGFRLRTKIKYYVETTKYGQRFISQTLNPKTNTWNNPKKSTYHNIILVGLNNQDHITYTSLSMYSSEEAQHFKQKYEQFLNDYQKTEIINIIKMLEVYDKVEYKCEAVKYRNIVTGEIKTAINIFELDQYERVDDKNEIITPVDEDKHREEQKNINRMINQVAVSNAAKETGINNALKTFKRSG